MKNEDITYRVLSIDPGGNFGVTISEGDMGMRNLRPIHAETLDLNRWAKILCPEIVSLYGSRFARIYTLRHMLNNVLRRWQPDFVTHENAFFNAGRVTAGVILTEYVMILRMCVAEYDDMVPIFGYAPGEIKSAVAVKGKISSDKDLVRKAIVKLPDLDLTEVNIESLDEHSVDSIAVGYCFLKKNR